MKYILNFLVLIMIATGCRCHRDATRETRHEATELARMEYRKIDSVWSSMSDRETIRVCYYPCDSVCTAIGETPKPSIRSIEIIRETVAEDIKRAETDSVSTNHRTETDFKSVETIRETTNTLPLAIGIAALLVAVCSFISYKRRESQLKSNERGQIFGFILSALIIVIGIVLFVIGMPVFGICVIVVLVAALVFLFVRGKLHIDADLKNKKASIDAQPKED